MTTKPDEAVAPADHLQPGEVEEHGGGLIAFDPLLRKHAIYSAATGELHGYRNDISKARDLARNIPSVNWTPPSPPEPSRSPRAMPLPPAPGVPGGMTKDMQPLRDPPPRAILSRGAEAQLGRYRRR